MLKKILTFILLLLPAVTLVGCSNEEDDPNGSNVDSGSNWVKIKDTKFSTQYSYIYLYDEIGDEDEDEGAYSIICSEVDLTDYLKGKPFKKTFSYLQFIYDGYVGTSQMNYIHGCYKIRYDSSNPDYVEFDKNGFSFIWSKKEPSCNPSGSIFKENKNGNSYSFEGKSLKALAGIYLDPEDEDSFYGNLVDFSLSINATPSQISETRSTQLKTVKESDQIERLRKLLRAK